MPIQSVRFLKSKWTQKHAKDWVKHHGYKTSVKPNPQYKNHWAFRQVQPEKLKHYHTKQLSNGVSLIIGK